MPIITNLCNKPIKRIKQFLRIIQFRGIHYFMYLITGYLIPNLFITFVNRYSLSVIKKIICIGIFLGIITTIMLLYIMTNNWLITIIILLTAFNGFVAIWYFVMFWRYYRLKQIARRMIALKRNNVYFTEWSNYPISPEVRQAVEEYRRCHPNEEIVLGRVDDDGRMVGTFGPLPGWINISSEQFVPRTKTQIAVVLLDDKVLIRKDFKGDKKSFLREWYALAVLMGQANVPAIYDVDEKNCIIYKNLIYGDNLNDLLVKAGAQIHTVVTKNDPSLATLSGHDRILAVLERGAQYLNQVVSPSFYKRLEREMQRIHRCGVTSFSLTFGNIVIDPKGMPWLIDFGKARCFSSTKNLLFLYYRDKDLKLYNQIYKQNHLTEQKARELLKSYKGHWYAPIDFGGGLAIRGFWNIDSGTGRWEVIRKALVPLIQGKRILDLGSNNGCMPLMMLREGAREVVGLEIDPQMVQLAKIVHRIMEWRDMREYAFTIYERDMRAILEEDFGKFDIITAFASLYYLSREDMARVVRKASTLAPTIIVQAKDDTRPEAGDKRIKSSTNFLKELLEKNGFPYVEVVSFRGYPRPILIGKTTPNS